MTTVVNCRTDSYDVFIGRPSKWGNPFSHLEGTLAKYKVRSRKEAISKHRHWFLHDPEAKHLRESLHELKGKRLGCFCIPLNCHGFTLAYFADNGLPDPMDEGKIKWDDKCHKESDWEDGEILWEYE